MQIYFFPLKYRHHDAESQWFLIEETMNLITIMSLQGSKLLLVTKIMGRGLGSNPIFLNKKFNQAQKFSWFKKN